MLEDGLEELSKWGISLPTNWRSHWLTSKNSFQIKELEEDPIFIISSEDLKVPLDVLQSDDKLIESRIYPQVIRFSQHGISTPPKGNSTDYICSVSIRKLKNCGKRLTRNFQKGESFGRIRTRLRCRPLRYLWESKEVQRASGWEKKSPKQWKDMSLWIDFQISQSQTSLWSRRCNVRPSY